MLLRILLTVGLATTVGIRAHAQEATAPTTALPPPIAYRVRPPTEETRAQSGLISLAEQLSSLDYDASARGPLLVVARPQWFRPAISLPPERAPLPTLAQAAGLRVVKIGQLLALVPVTIRVLNANPGPVNSFAGIQPVECLKLLLGTLTPAQWKTIASENGIGSGDLSNEQRPIWQQIFPPRINLNQNTVAPGPQPNTWTLINPKTIPLSDTSGIRLRLNKSLNWSVQQAGQQGYDIGNAQSNGAWQIGDTVYRAVRVERDPQTSQDHETTFTNRFRPNFAYGVPILLDKPNLPKPGALDYAAPALQPRISLLFDPRPAPLTPDNNTKPLPTPDATFPTVGDLMKRITDACGFEFIADKRARDLPVFLRGDNARAGDLLEALARSVGGTYRKIDAATPDQKPLYLLTEDQEGIGTRFGHLQEWANDARSGKRKLLRAAAARSSNSKPLAYLTFAPGDKAILTPDQVKTMEEGMPRRPYRMPSEFPLTALSPGLQRAIHDFMDHTPNREANVPLLKGDTVRISEELSITYSRSRPGYLRRQQSASRHPL